MEKVVVFGHDHDTRDGSCIRDYVHVMDIASAHVKAMQHLLEKKNKTSYSVYNLGSGEGVSVLEAIHAFEKVSGKKLNYELGPPRPGDVVSIYSDTSKVKEELGWQTSFSLDAMMETAWKWELHLKAEEDARS
jgi:UDP-glucose 4-epimerase